MTLVNNLQTFSSGASGVFNTSGEAFKKAMDTVLQDLGREITLHLPPAKSACSDPGCTYDSFYGRNVSIDGQVCQLCKGQGFTYETRQTIYMANIRWTDEPFNNQSKRIEEEQAAGRLGADFVRTKTVATAHDHIRQSIGANIDGINVELFEEPRYTGWGQQILYVIAWWKKVNR